MHQVMPLLEEIGLMGAEHALHLADDDERTGHLSIVMMAGSVGLILEATCLASAPLAHVTNNCLGGITWQGVCSSEES